MISPVNKTASGLIHRLREVIDPQTGALLVGGVVRDQITGTVCHDVDIILPGESRKTARRAADLLNGKFFPLDETRGMYRILLTGEDGQIDMVDISRLQADSLDEDLRLRDFTVNAIANRLHEPDVFIDPLNGRMDLKDRILRPCSDSSIENDPVRVIRAARISLDYNLRFAPGLLSKIRLAGPLLQTISAERKRDEIFKILDGSHPASAIRLLDTFNVLSLLLPAVSDLKGIEQSSPHTMDVFEHTLATVDQLKRLLDLFIAPENVLEDGGNLVLGLAAGRLGVFRENIINHYHEPLNPFRTRRSLCLFAALMHDIGKPVAKTMGSNGQIHFYRHENRGAELAYEAARMLTLSEIESKSISRMVAMHLRPRVFSKDDRLPNRRNIYRFYRQAKDFGVDICFLSLADFLAKTVFPPQQEDWIFELERIAVFLEGWFAQKNNWLEPARFLTGEDIMAAFHLSSGRIIGEVLQAIQEAQAAGEISNRNEALEYAKLIIVNPARESDE